MGREMIFNTFKNNAELSPRQLILAVPEIRANTVNQLNHSVLSCAATLIMGCDRRLHSTRKEG